MVQWVDEGEVVVEGGGRVGAGDLVGVLERVVEEAGENMLSAVEGFLSLSLSLSLSLFLSLCKISRAHVRSFLFSWILNLSSDSTHLRQG